jgi:transposase
MNTNKLTIGLDLGDRQHTYCVLSASGKILAEAALANTREVLAAFSARYPQATLIMETGTHSPWVSRLFQARGHTVIVANARKVRAISRTRPRRNPKGSNFGVWG